jgi:hypothetical protein
MGMLSPHHNPSWGKTVRAGGLGKTSPPGTLWVLPQGALSPGPSTHNRESTSTIPHSHSHERVCPPTTESRGGSVPGVTEGGASTGTLRPRGTSSLWPYFTMPITRQQTTNNNNNLCALCDHKHNHPWCLGGSTQHMVSPELNPSLTVLALFLNPCGAQ